MDDTRSVMTAMVIQAPGGPEMLQPQNRPIPVPGAGQVLIGVEAAGVNRPDVLQRQGSYPAPKGHSDIPGLEVAGRVLSVGNGVERFKPGDCVMALVNGGGYASHCVAEAGSTLPVPAGLSMVEAASTPETAFTVWHNVFERGRLESDHWLLIHGGTSGIGVMAIQVAKARGAKVIVTAGSEEKCRAARQLGADWAVNYKSEDFVETVKQATGGRGADVILDMVGADYVERNIRAAAEDGRIVNIAFQQGSKVTIDLVRVMLKRLTLTGSTLRIRTTEVKAGIAAAVEANISPLLADRRVRPIVDRVYPLAEAADAHRRMESSAHIGKIVLTV